MILLFNFNGALEIILSAVNAALRVILLHSKVWWNEVKITNEGVRLYIIVSQMFLGSKSKCAIRGFLYLLMNNSVLLLNEIGLKFIKRRRESLRIRLEVTLTFVLNAMAIVIHHG